MSYRFEIGDSPPSLTGSNSNECGLEEMNHRLCSFDGLPQAERRKISSKQDQKDNQSISFPADGPPEFMDYYISSSMLPSQLRFSPSTMNYHALEDTDDDCISGALSHAENRTNSSVHQHDAKALLGNHSSVKSSRSQRQLFAAKVQTSIQNLRILHDKLSNRVALDADGCGGSEGLPEGAKRNNLSPNHQGTGAEFEDSVSNFQVSDRRRRFSSTVARLEVESTENPITARVDHDAKSPDEGSWHWRSQTTQKCLTESPASRAEEGGESEYNGGVRSASRVDLEDLLSSLQALLCVLKNHEENEQILQAKMHVLRARKRALHEEKQQYKRQRNSECTRSPSLSQETVHV